MKCAAKGKSLKSGQYALSVKSEGTGRVVTITRNGETMNIRAQELTGNPAASHSTVLVRKSHEGRLLEAVYVRQLNVLLLLGHECGCTAGKDGAAADFVKLDSVEVSRGQGTPRRTSPGEAFLFFASNDLISC